MRGVSSMLRVRRLSSMPKDAVAVVTGSTSGIGLGIAQQLAKIGCRVVINGFGDSKAAVELVSEAAFSRKKVLYSDADMSTPEGCERLVTETVAAFGAPSILINNAGIQHTSPVDKFPTDKWNQILAINLSSAFHTTRMCVPGMRSAGWGRIVNVASVHGLVASVNKSAYVAAKHGIIGLTKTTALELATSGVTCNAVCPGWVRTPLVEAQIKARADEKGITFEAATDALIGEKMPSRTFVEIKHLAETVAFLCSDSAASIMGQAIVMDGGWTAQ